MVALRDSPARYSHILIVEDIEGVRTSLVKIAQEAFPQAGISGCGTLRQAEQWLEQHPEHTDASGGNLLTLIDLGLPDGNGISLVRKLNAYGPHCLPIVITIFDDDITLCKAVAAGAQGYLLKEHPPEIMVHYLKRMEQGEPPITPRMARRILACMQHLLAASLPNEEAVHLSPRETEVLSIIGRGFRVGEAARVLGLTDQTVASYVKSIYRKLNISSRAEAALEASRRKLV
ncbi:response regulator transcription factor [Pusillimonas sp. CC-YST705]|uniref:Response regulator transcription factor n=1 Tax=Mesopusillimonas faecipullorum TaxID=2755040 RepID=A0ABS8CF32_9BURK|nr:response regulator transcription factor [Mesopusillimonas faecipullorum]MCB5364646.1 response regulator transcription factor [Mesopusillimonas faecipullorum]